MHILQANVEHLGAVARLFDGYRQFYEQPSDLIGATHFLRHNLENNESVIFLAEKDNQPLGFVQLYPTWESVTMTKRWVLYDLFVAESGRGHGVGRALMQRAKQLAQETGAKYIALETAKNNTTAQALYESEGYTRDDVFLTYILEI